MKVNLTRQQVSWLSVQLQMDYERELNNRAKYCDYLANASAIGYDPVRVQDMIDECNIRIAFLKDFAREVAGL